MSECARERDYILHIVVEVCVLYCIGYIKYRMLVDV